MRNQLHVVRLLCAVVSLALSSLSQAHSVSEEMVEAAGHWLAALTPEQKTKASFDLESAERGNWHFIPRERRGLPLKEMTPAQRHLTYAFLSTALSQRGFVQATTIMSLEEVLRDLEQGKGPVRDPELYYVSIFGKPDAHAPWGWRVEGHHLSLNFTVVADHDPAVQPSFFGSNPGEVREGPRAGIRIFAHEIELARQLVRSLDDAQRAAAVYTNAAPADVLSIPGRQAGPESPWGLTWGKMNASQTAVLWELIETFARRYRPEIADAELAKISAAGREKLAFAWAGGLEPGQGHYFRVQGPTFIMEYDNTQNNANHVHTVWRDFKNDFGADLLKQHYEHTPHTK